MPAHSHRSQWPNDLWSVLVLLTLVLAPPGAHATGAAPAAPAACARIVRGAAGVARWLEHCGTLDAAGDPETVARAVLAARAAELGLRPDGHDLTLLAVQPTRAATHVRFAQIHQGVPVYLGQVLVQYSSTGEVQLINNHTLPDLAVDTSPAVAGPAADTLVLAHIGGAQRLRQPLERTLVIYGEAGAPVLAWHVVAYLAAFEGDVHFMVSATTGDFLVQWDEMWNDSGTGLIYSPNAVQTSGDTALRDNNDLTSPVLNAARTQVTLTHLLSNTHQLAGSYVDVTAPGVMSCTLPYVPGQANEPTRVYSYTRDLDPFEEATAYAAIDGVQTWFHALGFTNANNRAVPANVHCTSAEDSFYSSSDRALHFGDGGVDDAEDADIIIHEYGHSVQDNQVPGWGPGIHTEQRAIGQGFGDFLAGMYYVDTGDPAYMATYRYCIGEWDATAYNPVTVGNPGSGCLRWINGRDEVAGGDLGMYSGTPTEEHDDGRFWSAALTCVYEGMGADATARDDVMKLVIQHHFSLTPDGSNHAFEDSVAALLLADQNLLGGAHQELIRSCAVGRGLIPPPQVPAPALTYPTGGEVFLPQTPITITWDTNGAPVSTTYALEYTRACTPAPDFVEDCEAGPGAWTVSHAGGTADWMLVTTSAHSPVHSWFAGNEPEVNEQRLVSPVITPTVNAELSFWHRFETEGNWDGGVVEITSNNGGTWSDLGDNMTQNGYNSTLGPSGNPLSGRAAFTGISDGWIQTRVDLAGFANTPVRLRFREGDDAAVAIAGWWIDDVVIAAKVIWAPIGTSAAGAASMPWTTPLLPSLDYCVRLQGQAPGFVASAYDQSTPFTVMGIYPHELYLPAAFRGFVVR